MDKRDDSIEITAGCAKELLYWYVTEVNTFEGIRRVNGVWKQFYLDWIEIDNFIMGAEIKKITLNPNLIWLGYAIELITEDDGRVFMKHDEKALKRFFLERNLLYNLI